MTIRVDIFRGNPSWSLSQPWLELALRYWFLAGPDAIVPRPPAMLAEWGPGGVYYHKLPVSPPSGVSMARAEGALNG